MATLNFDARTVAPQTGFEPLPLGWYNVMVDESEMKPTQAGDGHYLKLRYNVLDGQYANRKIFGNINLGNKNPQAVEIGLKQLSAVAHAVGVLMVQDSQQLHGIPLKIKVKIRTDKSGEYEPQNDITQWKNINEPTDAVAGAPAAFAAPAGQPAAAPAWQQQAPVAQQPTAAAQPAWAGAPAPAAVQQPAAAPAWQQPAPAAQQQPWQAPAAAPAAQPAAAPAPTGFNPNAAVPPWAAR